MTEEANKAPATTQPLYSTEQLANAKSFDDILAMLADAGVQITDGTEYGDGFDVVDKDSLVKVPFVLIDYKFADGDFGSDFAILRIMTTDGRKGIITDGSNESGIRPQIKRLARLGVVGGLMFERGLVRSDYTFVDSDNKSKPATTYYLSGLPGGL